MFSVSEAHFYLELLAGLHDFCTWRAPLASLSLLTVYLYLVFHELLVPVLLLLLLGQLGLNFLRTQR